MNIASNLVGKRFGSLVAMYPTTKRKNRHAVWCCMCDCGNTCNVRADFLLAQRSTQCPECLKKFRRMTPARRSEVAAFFRKTGRREVLLYE